MIAPRGTIYYGLRPANDCGLRVAGPHFVIVVSDDALNAIASTRVVAWLTHLDVRLPPFHSHLCFTDPTPGQPDQKVSALAFWNLVELPTSMFAPPVLELGRSCDCGLARFTALWDRVVLGSDINRYLQSYIDRQEVESTESTLASGLDQGDIIEIQIGARRQVEVVLSCKEFHRNLAARARGNPLDSVVSMNLAPLDDKTAFERPELIVWAGPRSETGQVESYAIDSPPRRTFLRPATAFRRLDTLDPSTTDRVRRVASASLGMG
jgi:hypothetical protein